MDAQAQIYTHLGDAYKQIEAVFNSYRDDGGDPAQPYASFPETLELIAQRAQNALNVYRGEAGDA